MRGYLNGHRPYYLVILVWVAILYPIGYFFPWYKQITFPLHGMFQLCFYLSIAWMIWVAILLSLEVKPIEKESSEESTIRKS